MNIRAFAAIVLCKLLRFVSRLVHRGGTAMPGRWALKLCPNLLSILSANVKTVAITGTNGKTTSARMIEQALTDAGYEVFANRSGANLISGITTEFCMNCTLTGKPKCDYAVIECDEAATKQVFRQIKPRVIVVTNLFRDQLDRFGEIANTLALIREGIRGAENAVLCLNADCSLTSSLAGDVPNRVVYFGFDKSAASGERPELSDAPCCIKCKTEYQYDYISYAHLGAFRCPKCGYRRHATDYSAAEIVGTGLKNSTVVIDARGTRYAATINLPANYNIYNAVGAFAAASEMGVAPELIVKALSEFKCGFGRMEEFDIGKSGARMMLVKNPAGCNQVIDFLRNVKEKFVLVVCLNDRTADGTDISWIWDSDFEKLAGLGGYLDSVVVSGDRANDMRLRIKYAGIDEGHISLERDYTRLVAFMKEQKLPVLIMPTYTAMLELRAEIVRQCGGDEFWK